MFRRRRAILLAASLLALTLPRPAAAATITVNTFAQGNIAGCSIAEALASINAGMDTGGCVASGSYGTSDTIILPFGTYNFTTIDNGANGLPTIMTSLTINGNGSTLSRTLGNVAPFFRFIEVESTGSLTISNLMFTGGNPGAAEGGGAIIDFSTGALSVDRGTFSGNTAGDSGGAIVKNGGTSLTVSNSTFTNNHAGSGADGGAILDFFNGASSVSNSTSPATRRGSKAGRSPRKETAVSPSAKALSRTITPGVGAPSSIFPMAR